MRTNTQRKVQNRPALGRLVREEVNGVVQEYYPLGEFVVAQPQVCGGRPTIKYTRMTASSLLAARQRGLSVADITRQTGISAEAIREVEELAEQYDYQQSYA